MGIYKIINEEAKRLFADSFYDEQTTEGYDKDAEFEKQYQEYQKTSDTDPSNGELAGHVISTNRGNDRPVDVYKNPKSLKNFDANVRAIGDGSGNVYVAQLDGGFLHENIARNIGVRGIELYRVENSDVFGISGSLTRQMRLQKLVGPESDEWEVPEGVQDMFRMLNKHNPQLIFSFLPQVSLIHGDYSQEQVRQSIPKYQLSKPVSADNMEYFEEGTGDKYAERAFGIADVNKEFEKQGMPDAPGMGERYAEILLYDYSQSKYKPVGFMYKNPTNLTGFDSDVRAIGMPNGDLYVAQKNGDFVHGDMIQGLNMKSGQDYRGKVVPLHRVAKRNDFGGSDSLQGYFGTDMTPDEVDVIFEELNKRHPAFSFSPRYYENIKYGDVAEGVGDKYAEKAFGIPDADRQFGNKGVPDADMGEKMVEIWASSFGAEKENHGLIYKNPKTLNGFDSEVRAIAMINGDLYVAQQDGYFIHTDMELSLEKKIGFLDDYIEFHRVGNTNTFGASDTLREKIDNMGFWTGDFFNALIAKHPQFKFYSNYYQELREEKNYLKNIINEEIREQFGYDIKAKTPELNQNFWNWFGKSQVLDGRGLPAICYHQTKGDFDSFKTGGGEVWSGPAMWFAPEKLRKEIPAYGIQKNREADAGQSIMPVYLRIERPLIINSTETYQEIKKGMGIVNRGFGGDDFPLTITQEQVDEFKEDGYDGIFFSHAAMANADYKKDKYGDEEWAERKAEYGQTPANITSSIDEIIVFDPDQIKSVYNQGTWSTSDNVLNEVIGLLEGYSSYQEKNEWETQYQDHLKARSQTNDNGVLVKRLVDDNQEVINIYQNPKSLRNFGEAVRAISDNQGNLFVGQFDKEYLHVDMAENLSIPRDDYIAWHRLLETNKFNSVDIGVRGDPQQYIANVQKASPQFEFHNMDLQHAY